MRFFRCLLKSVNVRSVINDRMIAEKTSAQSVRGKLLNVVAAAGRVGVGDVLLLFVST